MKDQRLRDLWMGGRCMTERILDIISGPCDLSSLTREELDILSCEIREEIISVTSTTGGHVASSLGSVELIVALHSVLNCPEDKIVFDVGHQAYAHKLLTGRLSRFDTLRTYGGISGFCKPTESPFDAHCSGHASDSLSIATGLAKARDLRGTSERVVAVIGDASLSGGMAFEAMNHIGHMSGQMLIILNDNEMSISRNVGALMKHLGFMRASSQYRETRDSLEGILENRGKLAQGFVSFGKKTRESLKQFVIPRSMIFEQLGIVCTAPIDGHDIGALQETFRNVLSVDVPVLVHVVTKKGAGYKPAEDNPERFHGIAPFNIETGEVLKKEKKAPSYTEVFSRALLDEAERNEDIVAITAAMKDGTGLAPFAEKYPQRFIDVGIAEGHATGMAAGLATGGKKPVVAIYSTFLQRAIDQMIIDNSLADLDVVFCLDRAGVVGDDGPTHHGLFDMVYTRMVPNMRVLAPSNEAELVNALHTALALGGPFAIRYPRGEAVGVSVPDTPEVLEVGKSKLLKEGSDLTILAFGRMVSAALGAAEILETQGIKAAVVDMRWVKPLDTEAIQRAAEAHLVVTVEEGVLNGGAGEAVLKELSRIDANTHSLCLGIDDVFPGQGKMDMLLHDVGLDSEGIARSIQEKLHQEDRHHAWHKSWHKGHHKG